MSHPIVRRFVALVATAALVLTFAQPVSAHNANNGDTVACGTNGVTAIFYGSQYYVQSAHFLCLGWIVNANPGIPDLRTVTDSDDANCMDGLLDRGHWNNCISSFKITFTGNGVGAHVCLYNDYNYSAAGGGLDVVGNVQVDNLGGTPWSDSISSIKIRPDNTPCW